MTVYGFLICMQIGKETWNTIESSLSIYIMPLFVEQKQNAYGAGN